MQNGCNYGYYFIIKGLAEKFKKQVTRIDKNGKEITKKHVVHTTICRKPKIYGKLSIKYCQ